MKLVVDKVVKRPPFLILLAGRNANKECVSGLYCSAQLQQGPY
jgi:hypothetical protein